VSDRSRRILVASLVAAAVLLLGYASIVIALMVAGDYQVGPVRLLTVAANIVTGVLCLWGARVFSRVAPPRS
jgi:hypothetical protein